MPVTRLSARPELATEREGLKVSSAAGMVLVSSRQGTVPFSFSSSICRGGEGGRRSLRARGSPQPQAFAKECCFLAWMSCALGQGEEEVAKRDGTVARPPPWLGARAVLKASNPLNCRAFTPSGPDSPPPLAMPMWAVGSAKHAHSAASQLRLWQAAQMWCTGGRSGSDRCPESLKCSSCQTSPTSGLAILGDMLVTLTSCLGHSCAEAMATSRVWLPRLMAGLQWFTGHI